MVFLAAAAERSIGGISMTKNKPEIGAFALGAGSVFCGVRFGAPYWQFSVEQQRHLWRLSGVYFVDGSASLGAIWEKTEVII